MASLMQDIRYAFRMLVKNPGFLVIAALTLALGIGANTAMFSVVNTSLLRPLPFRDSARLVNVWARSTQFDFPDLGISLADIQDLSAQNTVFTEIAPHTYTNMTFTGSGAPQRLEGGQISAEFFPLLGMQPIHGRIFTAAEMQPGREREAILSYELWEKQFGGDPGAIGKRITLDGKPYAIVGVMPEQQHLDFASDLQFWTPLAPSKEELEERRNHNTPAVARLKPGVTVREAQANLDVIAARLAKAYPDADKGWSFHVDSLAADISGDAREPLLILLGAVGFVLLIACANVGNLFLSQSWARRRELAIRSALGASAGRIRRQLLAESVVVALIGGAAGLLLAFLCVRGLRGLLPPETPRVKDLSVDQGVLWFTLGISVLAGVLFGLMPALLGSRLEINAVLKEGGAGAQAGAGSARHSVFRRLLAAGEVALALVLVVGATLALQSFARLRSVHLGLRSDHLLTMNAVFATGKFEKAEESVPYVRQIVDLTRGIPGVEAASASLYAPLSGWVGESTFQLDGSPQTSPNTAHFNRAAPGYFETLGVPILAGRDFTEADRAGTPNVYIVNATFAKKFLGNGGAIGKQIWSGTGPNHKLEPGEIVGEVGDVRDVATKDEPAPEMFAPYAQAQNAQGISLAVRTKGDPLAMVSAIQERIWSIDKDQPVTDVRSMDQLVAESNAAPRFQTLLLGIFGGLGLVLAVIGIYGVISYSVSQRTREMGIRLALGAKPAEVLRLILGQGLKLALAGVVVGVIASLAVTRLMSSLLFGVSATDPLTFVGVAVALTLAAVAACYIPARRATRVDPLVALRYE